ncbi:MAG: PleD family two-component system response regulator [Anaerolineales bacterium]
MSEISNPMTESKTVLIVEDSAVQALSLMELLRQHGMEVLWALDGRLALKMAQHYRPEYIVLDLEMPEMDGLKTCERLKESLATRDIPIIMLTAHTETEAVRQGLDLGAIDYIPKDAFSGNVLLETLRQLELEEKAKIYEAQE